MKEKVKLSRKEYESLRTQLSSKDKENHNVAMAVIEHCNAEESLPYVLVLYKEFNDKVEGGFEKSAPGLFKQLKKLDIKLEGKLTSNKLWSMIKKYSAKDKQFVLDWMGPFFKSNIESWGYVFLKDVEQVWLTKESYKEYQQWKTQKESSAL